VGNPALRQSGVALRTGFCSRGQVLSAHSSQHSVKFHDNLSTMFREMLSSFSGRREGGKVGNAQRFPRRLGRRLFLPRWQGSGSIAQRWSSHGSPVGVPGPGCCSNRPAGVCDLQDLDPFPGQSTTDAPLGIRDVQLALTVDFKHPGSFRILPTRRIRIVAPRAGAPATGRSLHAQGLVRTQVVMLPAITVQPMLGRLAT
jgi:hypothetical protein